MTDTKAFSWFMEMKKKFKHQELPLVILLKIDSVINILMCIWHENAYKIK
jgi:hypothetical protein